MNYIDLHYPYYDDISVKDWQDVYGLSTAPTVSGQCPVRRIRIHFTDADCINSFTVIYNQYKNRPVDRVTVLSYQYN